MIIVPKNTWYAPHTRRGCSYQYFQFVAEETAAADGERLYGNMATGYRYCDTLPLVDQVFALPQKCRASSQVKGYLSDAIHEMLSDYSESNIKMNLCFLSALVQLCESAKLERESLADRVKRYINKYKFEPISLADISAHFGYTKQHLVRIFLGKFGYSPTEYIERQRLEHAATLLSDVNSKISEIATKCGFEDANYFTRRFRKFFGTTPREYRDSARKYAFNVINEYDYSM